MDGECLAQPPRARWAELKRNHLTAADLAEVLDRSPRTARRKAWNKPDASFPDPLVFGPKHRRWRAAQVQAWLGGLPVPVYPTAPVLRPAIPKDTLQNPKTRCRMQRRKRTLMGSIPSKNWRKPDGEAEKMTEKTICGQYDSRVDGTMLQ